MAKKSANKNEFAESAHRVWLAGLGALAAAGEEGEKLFSTLVDRGAKYEKKFGDPVDDASKAVKNKVDDVRSPAGKTVKGVQRAIDEQVTSALHRLGVPTRSEIAELSERVEKLTAAVDSKRSKTARKPRKKAAAKKAPARKTKARKKSGKTTKKKGCNSSLDMKDTEKDDSQPGKIGLALAGGGIEGAVYEIGAVYALDEALDGISFHELDTYVGVSAGAIIGSLLANGITPRQLWRAISERDVHGLPIRSEIFFTPAIREFVLRASMTPRLAIEALWDYARNPQDQTLLGSLARLLRALPVGFFDNDPIRALLEKTFSEDGRTDDFRELKRELFVVAADVDSGEPVCFGKPGWDHVPISRAVQASAALPVLYPAVEIDGRHYVDGVLLKTLHASVSLEAGVKLLICVNPIVPVDTTDAVEAGAMRRGKLIHRGLPTVLSQTFRTIVHSRLSVGMASYAPRFPGQDVILIEPGRDDYRMFFTNVFKFSNRRVILEHAYRSTRRQLLERKDELKPILERHGITLRVDVLEDPDREPPIAIRSRKAKPGAVAGQLGHALDRLETILGQPGG